MRLFDDLAPTRYLWVSVDGSDSNTGSKDAPMASIQAAVDAARPGTAVLVEAGAYHENVKVRSNGTEDAPIWIVSADGYKAAELIPLSDTLSTIYGSRCRQRRYQWLCNRRCKGASCIRIHAIGP